MFQKIAVSRSRLADQVYDQIVKAINQGLIGPSERIVQEKLAEQFNISRTPIREALFRLEQEGILVAAEHGGFVMRFATPREVAEVYEARQAIEGYCAAMLARSPDNVALDRIAAIIEKNEAASFETISEYYAANREIHHALVAATGNKYLLEMFEAMWNRSFSFGIFRLMSPAQLILTLSGHALILNAIRTGDPALAMQTMCDHILHGQQLQLSAPAFSE
jgi:GntR family transcriptional regulator, vanillate catabolism transcriptional regulator